MKNRRFSIFCACLVFGFFFALPSSLYAEEEVGEIPVEEETEPIAEEVTTEETTSAEPEATEETAPQAEEQTVTEPTEEIVEEIALPIVEEVTTEETTSTPQTATSTESSIVESLPTFTLHIRLEGSVLYEGEAQIPQSNVEITDNAGVSHTVNANSLLSALYTVDLAEDNFEITDLTYYESFGAFFMNCIKAADSAEPACGNWIFVVNDAFPYSSIDQYTLQQNDEVYVFFGSQYRALTDQESITLGQEITGQAQTYNYKTNIWEGVNSVTLSVIQDNPDNPWSPTVVTSSPASDTGSATFVLSATGSYKMGIDEDYFMHITPFLVIDPAPTASTSTPTSTPTLTPTSTPTSATDNSTNDNNSSCTNCNAPELVSQNTIDATIEKILAYIKTQQKTTGAIQDGATTDWLIMSFGAMGIYADTVVMTTTSLLDYAQNYSFSSGAELNLCAGYPRHVLALLAGGVDPSDNTIVELTQKIKSSECFDGTLYGEAGINDDLFALFSLLATGEATGNPEITALISGIKNDQQASGAFTWNGWEGADVTGAAINALKYAAQKGASIDTAIFGKAKNYLKDQQLNDGGWGFGSSDVLTTSWAIMGINALGEGQSDWTQSSGKNPWHILTDTLSPQGYYTSPYTGSKPDWFGVKHAIPALKGSTWPIILSPISANDNSNTCSGGCNSRNENTNTKQTTSTEQIPTSTPHSLLDISPDILEELIDALGANPVEAIDLIDTIVPIEEVAPVVVINEIAEEIAVPPIAVTPKPLPIPVTGLTANKKLAENTDKVTEPKKEEAPAIEPPTPLPEAQIDEASPGKKIAERVFNSAAAGTATVGLFLAWRFLRALL